MREIFTYGTVGGALGNQRFYPESILRHHPLPRMDQERKAKSHGTP